MMTMSYPPIGVIHSPFEGIENVPIQPTAADGIRGTVEVFSEFAAGLQDLEGFSHIILLYHFHRVTQARLTVIPFLDRKPRGVFATRAPSRPNPIGLSIVRLLSIEGNVLRIENVDVVDGTPLLDIKPYVPEFDHHKAERMGWLAMAREKVKETRSDDRFR
jgi:tRNA-Thr(GGU) m(6)t(6)A37 methyltransferase TsaA